MEVDQGYTGVNTSLNGANENTKKWWKGEGQSNSAAQPRDGGQKPQITFREVGESSTANQQKGEKRSQNVMSEVGESSNVNQKNPQKKQKVSPQQGQNPGRQGQGPKKALTRLEKKQNANKKNRLEDIERKKIAFEKKKAAAARIAQQRREAVGLTTPLPPKSDESERDDDDEEEIGKSKVHLIDASFIRTEHLTDILWNDVDISPTIKHAIKKYFKYDKLTEIQDLSLKAFATGRDFVAQSPTGSGKTLAFLVPIIHALLNEAPPLLRHAKVEAIILAPSVELIRQSHKKCLQIVSKTEKLSALKFIGTGKKLAAKLDYVPPLSTIVISSPQMVLQLMQRYPSRFTSVKYVVLDEADFLVDVGFFPTIEKIKPLLPRDCHFSLFSATFNDNIKENFLKILRSDYQFISAGGNPQEPKVSASTSQYLSFSDSFSGMVNVLYTILTSDQYRERKCLVFFPLNVLTRYFTTLFQSFGLNCSEYSGRTSTGQKNINIDSFRESKGGFIFSTDALARGVDISNIDLVVQFGIPQSTEFYLHRIGRTSRLGGVVGDSILILHRQLDEWFVKRNLKPDERSKLVPYDSEIKTIPRFTAATLFLPEQIKKMSEMLIRGILTNYSVALKNSVLPKSVLDQTLLFYQFLQIPVSVVSLRTMKFLNPAFRPILTARNLVEHSVELNNNN